MIDPLIGYPGYMLRRASNLAMARLAKRLRPLQLSPTEATVLNVIDTNPNAKQSEIGRLLDIASANMAPMISRLVKRELIERQPVDGRSHGLVLSRSGRTLAARCKAVFVENDQHLTDKMSAVQQRHFVSALEALMVEERVELRKRIV